MSRKKKVFDPKERAREKQASRDRDAARLASGEVTSEQLKVENDFFHNLDLRKFRIVAIGGRKFDP